MTPASAAGPQPGAGDEPGPLSPADGLAQLSFLIQGLLEHRAREHDLSVISTRLLGILRDRRPTMNELARFLDLDKSSVTGLVDRAERRGLVERVPSPADRRAVLVGMTGAGRQVVDAATARRRELLAEILDQLPAAQQTAVAAAFGAFAAAAGEIPDSQWPREESGDPPAGPTPAPAKAGRP